MHINLILVTIIYVKYFFRQQGPVYVSRQGGSHTALALGSGGLQEALRDTKKANLGAAEEGPGMPTDS